MGGDVILLAVIDDEGDEVDERNRDLATACAFRNVIVPVSKKDLSNRTTAAEYVEKRNAVVLYVNMESELTARLAGLKSTPWELHHGPYKTVRVVRGLS